MIAQPQKLPSRILEDQNIWDQACQWVNSNKKKIMKFANKFAPFSPYAQEDYLQQSYISAFFALKELCKKEHGELEAFFWTTLKKHFSEMATNPAKKDILGEQSKDKSPCVFEEYKEDYDENNKPPTTSQSWYPVEMEPIDDLDPLFSRTNIHKALSIMSLKERLAWNYLLGYHDAIIYTPQKMACIKGVSRQSIEKLVDSGLHRVVQYFGQQAHVS